MSKRQRVGWNGAAVALFAVSLLSACGNDTPEAMVVSAKRYLASNDYPAAAIQLKNALQKAPNLA